MLHQRFQTGAPAPSSTALRIYNEVATVLLVGIVFLVVLKSALAMFWGLVGLVGFSAVLMVAIAAFRARRG